MSTIGSVWDVAVARDAFSAQGYGEKRKSLYSKVQNLASMILSRGVETKVGGALNRDEVVSLLLSVWKAGNPDCQSIPEDQKKWFLAWVGRTERRNLRRSKRAVRLMHGDVTAIRAIVAGDNFAFQLMTVWPDRDHDKAPRRAVRRLARATNTRG